MNTLDMLRPLRYRAIWISDVHLGTKGCRADYLLDFLKSTQSKYLYLAGDIIDLWSMRRGVHWSPTQNEVVQTILKKVRSGTQVVYLPGNHDELFRAYDGMAFGAVQIRNETVHETADGRRLMVVHGDQFDSIVKCNRLASLLGTLAYDWLLAANRWVHILRRQLGFPYWSLAGYLKQRSKNAANYIQRFEQAVLHEVRRRGLDGLICGHIHRTQLHCEQGISYCNTGDWVENCTALVEHHDGSLELVHWSERRLTPPDTISAAPFCPTPLL